MLEPRANPPSDTVFAPLAVPTESVVSHEEEAPAVLPDPEHRARAAEHLVLVVEDQPDHRYFYSRVLRWAGYRVEEAPTGRLGLARALSMRPSLVIVDVGVPEMDGWELTAALRADPATCDVPIVIVSVYAFPADHERSRAVGCTMHLDKPVSPRDVLDAVDSLLGVPPIP